jgi:hypothetical protein
MHRFWGRQSVPHVVVSLPRARHNSEIPALVNIQEKVGLPEFFIGVFGSVLVSAANSKARKLFAKNQQLTGGEVVGNHGFWGAKPLTSMVYKRIEVSAYEFCTWAAKCNFLISLR